MSLVARLLSAAALLTTIGAPVLFFWGRLTLPQAQTGMLVATIGWFATAPLWMARKGD
jgi:hypothetical protein